MPKLKPGLRENIIEEYVGGLGGENVAKKLNCARSYVYKVLKSEGVTRKVGSYKKYKSVKDRELNKLYGISIDIYNKLFEEQQGCCAICGKHQIELKRALDVDHNHETGKVRGLLCPNCNWGLGNFIVDKKSEELLEKAIHYLRGQK